MGSPSSSSSGEEDGTAEWRTAIESVVSTTTFGFTNGSTKSITHSNSNTDCSYEEDHQHKPQKLKQYQVKAQKALDDILEKNLEIVRDPVHFLEKDQVIDGGVRLFKNSARGIVFDHKGKSIFFTYSDCDLMQLRLLGFCNMKSIDVGMLIWPKKKLFKRQLQAVVVDGVDILAAARDASQKSLARLEAKDAAAKAKAKREEERVAELKRVRGERWLPSVAREMQVSMVLLLGSVVNGLGLFFRTLWGLQERRFSSTFRVVSSVAVSMTMALVVCFMSVHQHGRSSRGGEMVIAFI
ncbi:hypothetical protein Patl1_28515 [Pistacia atlantica]|uniref:Uncharacterized protein n=1 Tax=Pistacia atlantica TaxID=434234 RepID=A0ACC1BET3_9ROSI|nr:hypothetical protein Patl1_28515 [Pistacia atlantica]